MSVTQRFSQYRGVQVMDVWRNHYLVTKDLLAKHDLRGCECHLSKCPIQIDYFLRNIEPVATRSLVWQEMRSYALSEASAGFCHSDSELLGNLSVMFVNGDLGLFKVMDGADSVP